MRFFCGLSIMSSPGCDPPVDTASSKIESYQPREIRVVAPAEPSSAVWQIADILYLFISQGQLASHSMIRIGFPFMNAAMTSGTRANESRKADSDT